MAIKRRKLDRVVSDLGRKDGRLVHLSPDWKFTIDCRYHGKLKFDFTPLRAGDKDDIAAHWRDAVWNLRHSRTGTTLQSYRRLAAAFFRFLAECEESGFAVTRLQDIDRHLVESYIGWMGQQTVNRGKHVGHRWSIATQIAHYAALKAVLKNRRRWVPEAVNPLLEFPRNPFPNSRRLITKRTPYSESESKRILAALNRDLRSIHEGKGRTLTSLQVLVVHLLALALATGRNQQALIELHRDCLSPHPIPGREFLTTEKRRGYSIHVSSFQNPEEVSHDAAAEPQPVTIPTSIGNHIRWLAEHTLPLVEAAKPEHQQRIFLRVQMQGDARTEVMPLTPNAVSMGLISFVARHSLLDDAGAALALNIARLRPTFGNAIYVRSGGDLRAVQKALNHRDIRTTGDHYLDIPPNGERNHALVVEGMVGWAKKEVRGKVIIAADGRIPLANVKDLLSGGYNTGVARCRNPFREEDSVCSKFFTCFRCQNMVVFEDDLWRLFSFYYRLLDERVKVAPHHWLKTYGPIINRIDKDIAPQFPAHVVAAARERARHEPHPTWKSPLL